MPTVLKRELRSYLHTPMAYIFIVVFLLLSSVFFIIGNLAARSGSMLNLLGSMSYLLMLLCPILSMRLLSAGTDGGDQLLYQSALPLSAVVTGKYLAAVTVLLCGAALSLIYPTLIALYGTLSIAETLTGYLGFLLMGMCFLSMDMLVAAVSRTPTLALLSAFGLNLLVWLSDLLGQAAQNALLQRAAAFLSLYRRLSPFLSGRLSLSNLIYDLSFIAVMLFLCVRVLEIRRWRGRL